MASIDRLPAAIASRITPVALMLVGGYVVAIAALVATSTAGLDAAGRPLGTDFSNVWSAGRLTLAGAPEAAYDIARHYAAQVAEFGDGVPFYGWHYPPMFLALAGLLATLPYVAALAVWQAATLPLYLAAVAAILPEDRGRACLAALAFPAVFVNLTHGHNGFLTAGLFGFGLLALGRRPVLAGVLFGLLSYKPQFALLLPFALLAGGCWRAVAAAAATVCAAAALSYLAFGAATWAAFADSGAFTRTVVLEAGSTGWQKIMTAFAAARALGADVGAAYVAQGAVTLATIAATALLWCSQASFERKAAALLAGSLLVTPYALDYDMALLAPAIAFLVRDGRRSHLGGGAAAILLFAFAAPLFARGTAELTLLPVGLIAILSVFILAAAPRAAVPTREPAHAAR